MITYKSYLPQAKLRKTISLLKGFGSLFNGHPDSSYSQERFNIGVAFSSERGEKQD